MLMFSASDVDVCRRQNRVLFAVVEKLLPSEKTAAPDVCLVSMVILIHVAI